MLPLSPAENWKPNSMAGVSEDRKIKVREIAGEVSLSLVHPYKPYPFRRTSSHWFPQLLLSSATRG